METIELENGKYRIELDLDVTPPVFKCYRYGEEWRNLTGDGMLLALVFETLKLKNRLAVFSDRRNWANGLDAQFGVTDQQPEDRPIWLPNWEFGLQSLPDSILSDYSVTQVEYSPWALAQSNWKNNGG